MTPSSANADQPFDWAPLPEAAALVAELLEAFCSNSASARDLGRRMHQETGTRLIDWIDHFALPSDSQLEERLTGLGFSSSAAGEQTIWEHPRGIFPSIVLHNLPVYRAALKVESVEQFLFTHGLDDRTRIEGGPLSPLRKALAWPEGNYQLWAVERHGYRGIDVVDFSAEQTEAVLHHREAFRRRRRDFQDEAAGFEHAVKIMQASNADLGVDRSCDLFFAAERDYWQSRNRAGRVQKARQDVLGLGWANHDHHTYRSSRQHFKQLVAALEEIGMQRRERFYAGREAGWGAQVLEQAVCGIAVFADVDLEPEEVEGDFASAGLAKQEPLKTIGLWCKLHGEAFLQAGMHHLECVFDYQEARDQLAQAGVASMPPFTSFDFLKQCFTNGEMWPIDPKRLAAALAEGAITEQQAEQFRSHGAVGSHLEVLERNDGFKGFNQTGISDIISRTDPRLCGDSTS